jgi:hypothetical protein
MVGMDGSLGLDGSLVNYVTFFIALKSYKSIPCY